MDDTVSLHGDVERPVDVIEQNPLRNGAEEAPSPTYVSDFLATSDGLALTKAFMEIKEPKLRRRIVDLVEEIAGRED